MGQEDLIKKYKKLKEKYQLPNFEDLNKDFEIEKNDDDSTLILKDIRKSMISKFSSMLQFVELLINPTSGSMFNMLLVKGINGDNKENLTNLFEKLGEIEIESFDLDLEYSEELEAKFIKEKSEEWKDLKKDLKKITSSLKDNWKKVVEKKQRTYFG